MPSRKLPRADVVLAVDPGTCHTSQLRKEVWLWLEAGVTWLSHEHVSDVADLIPTGQALTSYPLEEVTPPEPALLHRMDEELAAGTTVKKIINPRPAKGR